MFKQPLLITLLLIVLSCGEDKKVASNKLTEERSATSINNDNQEDETDTTDKAENTIEHEAYKDDINNLPQSLSSFVRKGYTTLDTTAGNLNLDPYPDMIMVLKKNDEEKTSDVTEHPEKRPLLILLGEADGSYKLAAESVNAVYCIDCGGVMGDPFMNVVVKNGYFSVEHYGGSSWRWTRTVTFKYSPADSKWYLHKDGGDSFHAAEPEKVTTKVQTAKDFGKVPFDQFNIYKEE